MRDFAFLDCHLCGTAEAKASVDVSDESEEDSTHSSSERAPIYTATGFKMVVNEED